MIGGVFLLFKILGVRRSFLLFAVGIYQGKENVWAGSLSLKNSLYLGLRRVLFMDRFIFLVRSEGYLTLKWRLNMEIFFYEKKKRKRKII